MSFKDLSKFNLYKKQIELIETLFNQENTIIKKAADAGCDYAVAMYLLLRALKFKPSADCNSYNVAIVAPNIGGGEKILGYIKSFLENIPIEFSGPKDRIKLSNSATIGVVSSSKYALVGRNADVIYVSNLSSTRNGTTIFDNAFQVLGTNGQLIISSRIDKRGDLFDDLLKDTAFNQIDYKWSYNPNNNAEKLMSLIDNLQFTVLCQNIYCKYADTTLK